MTARPIPTTAKRDISVVLLSGCDLGQELVLEDHPHRPKALISLLKAHILPEQLLAETVARSRPEEKPHECRKTRVAWVRRLAVVRRVAGFRLPFPSVPSTVDPIRPTRIVDCPSAIVPTPTSRCQQAS